MTLRKKILLCSVAPVVLLMAAVIVIVVVQTRNAMVESARHRIRVEIETAADVIEQGNRQCVHLARAMAAAQEGGMFGRRRESLELARKVLVGNPRYIGAYFGYEPNADGADRRWRAEGMAAGFTDKTGRFLPYWFREPDAGGKITLEPLVDMETSLYYQGMKERFLGGSEEDYIVTEPYVYNNKNLIIEQTSPIVIDGRFAGIAGLDRGLDFLDTFLNDLKPYETASLMLVSGRGRIIATTVGDEAGADLRTMAVDDLYLNKDGTLPENIYAIAGGKKVLDATKLTADRERSLNHDLAEQLIVWMKRAEGDEVGTIAEAETGAEKFITSARIPTGNWILLMSVQRGEIMAPIKVTMQAIAAVALAGLVLGVAFLVLFTSRIVRRIERVGLLTRRVADGDLSARVRVESSDETGLLQGSIRDMITSLNGLIGKVRGSTIGLSATATELFVGVQQQTAAVNEFGSSTTQITAAARQIAATSGELLGMMIALGGVAEETARLAEAGNEGLREMGSTVDGLKQATAAICDRLREIAGKAAGIDMAVTTIARVADRTNMLSLNASIEAEKAGRHGRGFAVVAREVRRLADQTAQATLDIAKIVEEMQSAVKSGVAEMSDFTGEVRSGSRELQRVGDQMEGIIERVQSLTARFPSVAGGMQSQSDGATQIRDALVGLADGVRRTEGTLAGFQGASDRLQASLDELRDEVARFQVQDELAEAPDILPRSTEGAT